MASAANGDLIMEQLANAGQLMCVYAGCFPPADEMAWRIPKGTGGPMALGETSQAWKDGATALQEIQTQLREQTEALGEETWRGKDRDAFDQELNNLLAELGDSHNTAEAIGITLEVLSPVLAVWPPLCLTAGMAVAACATAFYLAAASGIGDVVGASEAAYATGLPVAEAMSTMLSVAEGVLIAALGVAQLVIAGAVFADVTTQKGHGDTAIVGDLGQAEVDGLGQVAVNLAQYGVSRALGGKKPGEGGVGGEGGTGEGGVGGEGGTGEGGEGGTGETGAGGEGGTNDGGAGGEGGSGDDGGTNEGGTDEGGAGDGGTGDDGGTGEGGDDGSGSGDEGSGDGGSGDGGSGDGGSDDGGSGEDGPPTKPPWGEVGREAGTIGVDTGQHQTADRTHAGSRLQDLINDTTGWQGPG